MRVVLTSVLKPVTDPRLRARLGRTLAELPGAEVHIVAHRAADAPTPRPDEVQPNLHLHPLFDFPRLSLARARAGHALLKYLARLKPDVLVVGAAELLPAGLHWQRQTGGHLVYDVRENYALNVRTQGIFPAIVAPLLAARIEHIERVAAPRLSGVLLAERVYAEQLPWLANCQRVEIIENKYQPANHELRMTNDELRIANNELRITNYELQSAKCRETSYRSASNSEFVIRNYSPPLRLLVTGTLSALYGTFRAIALADALVAQLGAEAVQLEIAGYCPLRFDYEKLNHLAASRPWLTLLGGDQPIPHPEIVAAIRRAHLGLLPYQSHPSLDTCIPTKLWEYLGEGLPIIVPPNPLWADILRQHQAGFAIDFHAFSEPDDKNIPARAAAVELLLEQWRAGSFYPAGVPAAAFWQTEAARLKAFFTDLRRA